MDAGFFSSLRSSENKSSQTHSRRCHHPPRQYGDRFIPDRSSMDFALAHYLLVESKKEEEKRGGDHPFGEGYQKLLAETLMMNRSRILVFNNKSHKPVRGVFQETLFDGVAAHQLKSSKPRRYIPKCADRTLDAPGLLDDYYLNLLDWSTSNVLAVALGNAVYLWNASVGTSSELFTIDEETGPVTSISWAPSGQHIAVGMDSSIVEIWDVTANRKLRTLRDGHRLRVGSLSWNNQILTTGGKDSLIINNDVRIQSPIVQTYRGHHEEVCGLKWSNTEKQLASGGNDDVLYIWDKSMASSNYSTQWLHKLDNHTAAVKALAWCPYQSNLLASGGGSGDGCIKFWNTHTGACLNSVDTDSQVCSLLWNKNERELLSSHGFGLTQNQLTLWKYPSMTKIAEFTEHTDRILFMAQSPDGCTLASAAADETLKFWSIFGAPGTAKPAPKTKNMGPFTDLIRIR